MKRVRITTAQPLPPVALHWPSLLLKALVQDFWMSLAFCLPAVLVGWFVCRLWARRLEGVRDLRFRNQVAERTRVARDLNDTLLQTIEASKMIADDALDLPADPVRMRRTMKRLSEWLGRATEEGRLALDSLDPGNFESGNRPARPLSARIRKLVSPFHVRKKRRGTFGSEDE